MPVLLAYNTAPVQYYIVHNIEYRYLYAYRRTGMVPVQYNKNKPQEKKVMLWAVGITSATVIQGGPPGYFIHICITTPIASASSLKNYCAELPRSPNWFFYHFRIQIQVTVSLLKRPLRNRFGSETVTYKFIAVIYM